MAKYVFTLRLATTLMFYAFAEDTDFCDPNPCKNGGSCIKFEKRCLCSIGYTGKYCEKCKCKNGFCKETGNEGNTVCDCHPGWGLQHSTRCKECECGEDSNCTFTQGFIVLNKQCLCKVGYEDINGFCKGTCNKNPCQNGGTCRVVNAGIKCDCKDYFSGELCEKKGEGPAKSICSWMFYRDRTCPKLKFLCKNGQCIDRKKLCNDRNDCGDDSDEQYCRVYSGCPSGMRICPEKGRCIYNDWFCDGKKDCYYGKDEENCDGNLLKKQNPEFMAVSWLMKQRASQSVTGKWGSHVDKSAVVLHLSSNISTHSSKETRNEMAYEISIQLLSRLTKEKLQDIPSSDLASYLNAFLVTCLDPTKFHGVDIVRELRSRVDAENSTIPYVLLSLCNAGDTMTTSDTQKLYEAFSAKRREFWTDVQSVAVMALACASQQPGSNISAEKLRELTLELKQAQYSNGTVGNLQTTALIVQALISAAPEEDPANFDHEKAIQQILAMQEPDGSFGSFQNTYYVLPVLSCQSLLNVSSDHCELQPHKKDEKSALEDLANKGGPKIEVSYSLWFGDDRDLARNLSLRVPANTSFYEIMEMAAEIDFRYRFEYVVKNGKPYVNAISGYQDDPEREMFWYYYPVVNGQRAISKKSPADVIAKDHDHFVMWYRSEVVAANFWIQ